MCYFTTHEHRHKACFLCFLRSHVAQAVPEHAREEQGDGDELRGGQNAHAAPGIVPDELDEETAHAVEDQVNGHELALPAAVFVHPQQDQRQQHVGGGGEELGGQQRHAGGGKAARREHHGEGRVTGLAVAAAGQETADASESLSQRHRGQQYIGVGGKGGLVLFGAEPYAQHAADDAAVDHEALTAQDGLGIRQEGLPVGDDVENFGTAPAEEQCPEHHGQGQIIAETPLFSPGLAPKHGNGRADADHETVAVDGETENSE